MATAIERFMAKVNRTESCWLWTGAGYGNGYGSFYLNGRAMAAHRAAWELYRAEAVPSNLCACHKCDVRRCVNPWHLFIGTVSDNQCDSYEKGRCLAKLAKATGNSAAAARAKMRCGRGHAFDEANTHIRRNGRRECRACRSERKARFMDRAAWRQARGEGERA